LYLVFRTNKEEFAGAKTKMKMKWTHKNCPRCKGNVYLEKDMYGWYEQCLQCGYSRDLDTLYVEQILAAREDITSKLPSSYVTARKSGEE
jgi:hypothetical protein